MALPMPWRCCVTTAYRRLVGEALYHPPKKGEAVMKKFDVRKVETLKTNAAEYPWWMCWPY